MDGVVNILKPPGMSSSNAVCDVRRIFGEKRAGHLGTLDPGAAGVLPVCIGRATKLFDYLVDKEKTYIFEIGFGMATDTQDAYGTVAARGEPHVERAALEAALPSFLGEQWQTAPLYSALKVDGRRMCDMARAGEIVTPKTRPVTIYELELVDQPAPSRALLRLVCSRGTYVRALAEDIGKRLGTCAYVAMLLRSAAGPFHAADAYTVPELEALRERGRLFEAVTRCEDALAHLPALRLDAARRKAALNGLETSVPRHAPGDVRLYADGFLGVGRVDNGSVKLVVWLS